MKKQQAPKQPQAEKAQGRPRSIKEGADRRRVKRYNDAVARWCAREWL